MIYLQLPFAFHSIKYQEHLFILLYKAILFFQRFTFICCE